MPLPNVDRVIYDRNPLVGVTFHARFSRLLEVDSELPTAFQKKVLPRYPLLEEREVMRFTVPTGPTEIPGPSENRGKVYEFISEDKIWKISLSSDYLTLNTTRYRKWEEFRDKLQDMLQDFLLVYEMPIFTRIGLKYQNVIDRTKLGLEDQHWAQILKPHVAGEFADKSFEEKDFLARQCSFRVRLGSGDNVQVTHGIVRNTESNVMAYRFDGDFYNEDQAKADIDGIVETTNRLNANSGRLFHWAIEDQLHAAMGPKPA